MPYIGISQDLTPKIHYQNRDTLFCFTIDQSRAIAELLTAAKYNEAVVSSSDTLQEQLETVIATKEDMLVLQDSVIANQQLLLAQHKILTSKQKQQLQTIEKTLKKQKNKTFLATIGLLILSVVAIIK